MGLPRTILFLCPHNAAESGIAATFSDQFAAGRGLTYRAGSAGTALDERPSPVVNALRKEGIDVTSHQPRLVTAKDLVRAQRVISLGCDLNGLPRPDVPVEQWDDVPPASQDLAASREAIRRHVNVLLEELAGDGQPPTTDG